MCKSSFVEPVPQKFETSAHYSWWLESCPVCGHDSFPFCCDWARARATAHDAARCRELSLRFGIPAEAFTDSTHPAWGTMTHRNGPGVPDRGLLLDPETDEEFREDAYMRWSTTPPIWQALRALVYHPFDLPRSFWYKGVEFPAAPLYDQAHQTLSSCKGARNLFKWADIPLEHGEHVLPPEIRWNLLSR